MNLILNNDDSYGYCCTVDLYCSNFNSCDTKCLFIDDEYEYCQSPILYELWLNIWCDEF